MLDDWWFDHNHDDSCLHAAARDNETECVSTAIDANVFFDLANTSRPPAEDSAVMEADWLQDSITLCVTPKMFHC